VLIIIGTILVGGVVMAKSGKSSVSSKVSDDIDFDDDTDSKKVDTNKKDSKKSVVDSKK